MAREAKKDPSELTVEEKLKALYQLQTMLSEIDKIKTLRGELPLEVQDLEDEVAGLSTRIEKIKADIEELKSNIATKKIEIETAKTSVEKYKAQQDNVRNNREYDVLTKEIEFQSLEIELCEKRIKEYIAAEKAKSEEIEHSNQDLDERKKDLEAKKSELEEIVSETKQEEEKLREKAKVLETTIEPRLLQAFKRIRKNSRNGLGIVYVQRDACGGCSVVSATGKRHRKRTLLPVRRNIPSNDFYGGGSGRAYINLRELQQELEVVNKNCASQEEVLKITEVRYNTGLVAKLDVAQAKSVLYSTKASIPQLEAGINQYITMLAVLLGMYPQDIRPVLGTCRNIARLYGTDRRGNACRSVDETSRCAECGTKRERTSGIARSFKGGLVAESFSERLVRLCGS